MTTHLIDQIGSLNLLKDHSGVLLVQLRDTPHHVDSLSTARRWNSIDGVSLNGSQVVTVKGWFETHRDGAS